QVEHDEVEGENSVDPEPEENEEDSLPEQQSRDGTPSTTERKVPKSLTCSECNITYTHPEMLNWHMENLHGPNPTMKVFKIDDKRCGFQCIECKKRFKDFYSTIRHLRDEHQLENLPFRCTVCNVQFMDKFKLRKHKVKCSKVTRKKKKKVKKNNASSFPKCDQCDASYSHPEMLTWHIENCHGDDPIVRILKHGDKKCGFQCVECDLENRDIYVIIRHLVTEHQLVNLPFHCSVCNKQFVENYSLKHHQLKCNTLGNSLKCDQCEISYSYREMLAWHMANCHGDDAIVNVLKLGDNRRIFHCIECGMENGDIYNVIRHLRDRHQLENFPFHCYMCKKHFVDNYSLKQHELKCNTASGSSKCDQCDISYFHREMLAWHVENCHGTDPIVNVIKFGDKRCGFQCVECGVENRDIYTIIKHLVSDHQLVNLPFSCKVCSEQFIESRQLRRHKLKCRKAKVNVESFGQSSGGILNPGNIKTEPQDEDEQDFVPNSPKQRQSRALPTVALKCLLGILSTVMVATPRFKSSC
ncbi:hypothetical protein B566_EDAN008759, partial [Ephemera danica]